MKIEFKTLENNIKIMIIGDIHLGHNNNKTDYIINSLKNYFKVNSKLIKELDYIIINGDLFEKALLTYSIEYMLSMEWLFQLVKFCSVNNIKLRLLEGTPSHDNRQGKIMPKLLKDWNLNIDFKYIQDIEIEYDIVNNIHILYVPDRNDKIATERFKDIKKLMSEYNITKVDFAFMHGNFKYQLPVINEFAHDEESFLDIVRFYIVINHIHIPSVFDRILAPGSFERLRHGEEEDKGGIFLDVKSENDMKFFFIKNPTSRIFKTIRITKEKNKIESILRDIHKELKNIPENSFVRLLSKHKLEISKEVKELYKLSGCIEEISTKDKANIRDLFNIKNSNIVELQITKENVFELISTELKDIDIKYLNIIEEKIKRINAY